jgi:hypothetical protein
MALDLFASITIDEKYINEILSVAGYPVVTLEDFEIKEKSDLIDLVIRPALREYYSFFPIILPLTYDISSSDFNIDFPTNETFDVIDARVNTLGSTYARPVGNPLVDARYWWPSRNSYGSGRYDYNTFNAYFKEKNALQSVIDTTKAIRIDVDQVNRKAYGYCNTFGKLNITWATYSNDFNAIPMIRMKEVLDLCKGYFLEKLVMIRGQQAGGLPVNFNYQLLLEKSKDLIDKTTKAWENYPKICILKS